LSYVLVSDGDAVVVDPGRHLERYDALLHSWAPRRPRSIRTCTPIT
jgi:hypothetical protein